MNAGITAALAASVIASQNIHAAIRQQDEERRKHEADNKAKAKLAEEKKIKVYK